MKANISKTVLVSSSLCLKRILVKNEGARQMLICYTRYLRRLKSMRAAVHPDADVPRRLAAPAPFDHPDSSGYIGRTMNNQTSRI